MLTLPGEDPLQPAEETDCSTSSTSPNSWTFLRRLLGRRPKIHSNSPHLCSLVYCRLALCLVLYFNLSAVVALSTFKTFAPSLPMWLWLCRALAELTVMTGAIQCSLSGGVLVTSPPPPPPSYPLLSPPPSMMCSTYFSGGVLQGVLELAVRSSTLRQFNSDSPVMLMRAEGTETKKINSSSLKMHLTIDVHDPVDSSGSTTSSTST